jgi:leader peptidase (prepilin peptidase)/N-methyltransferase
MPSDAPTTDVTETPADDAAPNPVEEVLEAVDTHEQSATQTPLSELIPRHPLVPVFCIGLPILAIGVFGFERQTVIAAIASVVLTILAAIDIEHRVLPNRIVVPATLVILALQLLLFPGDAVQWLLAGLAAAAFLAAPLIFRRDAMGLGDIKLAVLLGTIVGWDVFGAIVIGCFAIVPFALWMRVRQGSIKGATLPFGPFLAFGTLVILFTS